MTDRRRDIVVVGAGIVGLAVCRELVTRHPGLQAAIVERETEVGLHQTGHNSGVIHSGVYYTPGSLKARLCVEGARLMYDYCDEHAIPYERCGKLIVAIDESELGRLDDLEARGRANGVAGLRRVRGDEIPEIEPECRGLAALHCPTTGIVDYGLVARALRTDLERLGVDVLTGVDVQALSRESDTTVLSTSAGRLEAGMVISCAGLWSDRLARASGATADPRIVPFRGGYLRVRATDKPLLRGLVYPVPDPDLPFLGVHVTRHIGGAVVLGPTALLVGARDAYRVTKVRWKDVRDIVLWPGTWRMARRFWRTGIKELWMALSRRSFVRAAAAYVPAVRDLGVSGSDISGVRAQALARDGSLVDDFVISETPGVFHVRNAPSPAATSSLALARELADRVERSDAWTCAD
jgi:L-2-hydroxyglutarate oxidase LhgO